ncbi:glycosyltransferase [Fibrobacter sp. UWB13]|uniref:glycosyltransferase n=1 Tax=Fibrobacter sp. UWB13 TaxID=1896204 RepID=UPI000A0E1241|nr:glycosyltransferase [Fibrobacter sp. UWB13]SMG16978.1 Glycosyl transferase family 2 [Fibrobacter sp. UWB13]
MKVNVYLSYYNGSEYIDDQIASLLKQKNVDVHIYIRDDGSNETEAAYIDKYCGYNKITVIHSENLGFGRSFMWLANKIAEKADFYAFCDQDDVWLNNKLEKACERLKKYTEPAAYSALPQYVDSKLSPLNGCSSMVDHLHFGKMNVDDALGYQFFGLGCTFVWNNALNNILHKIDLKYYSFAHDNFLSVLTPFIGTFYRDDSQVLLYRQHNRNASGNKKAKRCVFKKITDILKDHGNSKNFLMRKYIVENFREYMSNNNLKLLEKSVNYRTNISDKIKLIRRELHRVDQDRKIKNLIRILTNQY